MMALQEWLALPCLDELIQDNAIVVVARDKNCSAAFPAGLHSGLEAGDLQAFIELLI